ncbi:MAG: WD40 repeat domain-containing protein [Bacillota bacterium]
MTRFRLVLLILTLLILQACAKAPPLEPPAPPPAPDHSPITWRVTHTGSGLSAPVDRASVEEALRQNLGHGRLQVLQWSSDSRLLLTVEDLPEIAEQYQVAIDPSGGRDLNGKPLQAKPVDLVLTSFFFWPSPPTGVVKLDPLTGQSATIARHPQPYQSVSLSPDGSRMLLRRHILTPGQSVGTTGTAALFDLKSGYLEDLEVGGRFEYEWSQDGGLLVHGGCRQGATCVVWVAPGPPDGSARGGMGRMLYTNGPKEFIASAHLSPGGRYAAAFAGQWEQPLNLHLFDLHPDRAGRMIVTVAQAAGVTQGPSGLTYVPVAWSPDGQSLAFGDGGIRRESNQPMKLWLVDPLEGKPIKLADEAGDPPGPWSPDSTRLFVWETGVLDQEGNLLFEAREPGTAAWSPDGTRLYYRGGVYETKTWSRLWSAEGTGDARWSPSGQVIALGSHAASGGGLFRADGTLIAGPLTFSSLVRFSPDGSLAYLPNPDRVVEIATGQVHPIQIDLPAIPGLGEYRPVAFTADNHLLLTLGQDWER